MNNGCMTGTRNKKTPKNRANENDLFGGLIKNKYIGSKYKI